ncbi:PstS family phosphate ABC transporter substrate-binding protein [Polluticaenibacter yanchengensis]|uniref:Substrate-binding domain-containing protein n=1 Tax=Polluticaenibacter yanchengensis TaxID=3014562 RepID=A0ABT4UEV8_9BACT|nr:substrate-binding domain-containing protein [Chitinophagaceae bacterium LY-5]
MKINKLSYLFNIITVVFSLAFMVGCNSSAPADKNKPSATNGTIHVSVDESFKPIIDSQIKVFNSTYPDAIIIPEYKPEAECFKDLDTDSTKMVIVTRGLTDKEAAYYKAKDKFTPQWGVVAFDAIAVILNEKDKRSEFSVDDIIQILNGNPAYKYTAVFDGIKATSTVQYAIDSLLRGQPLGKNVYAAKNSLDVIDYVSKNENTVGFIGVSWIGNRDDPQQQSFLKSVKLAAIDFNYHPERPVAQPYQANIALGRYAFTRGVYYILRGGAGTDVGNNFSNFLMSERGQLIFKRAYLLPARMKFNVRKANISE